MVSHGLKSHSEGGISLLQGLISDVSSKQVAKRTLFSNLPFEIGPDFTISVKGYNLLQKAAPARSTFVYTGGEVAQIAVGKTEKIDESTRKVSDSDVKKAYKFGGSQVEFTVEEIKQLKKFGSPVLRIIGFKPQSMLPQWASVKKSTFIYPSEEGYIGSTRTFAALWQKLLKDKIMGLAWYIARSNATPSIVAILPSAERLDDTTGAQVIPPGLWLYPLPFADDIREPGPSRKPIQASDDLINEMRIIVKQLQLPKGFYDPTKYPNPSLQWHYRILQAMALNEDIPTKPEDKTIPRYKQIEKRTGEYVAKWADILDKSALEYQKESYGGIDGSKLKRSSSEDADEGAIKKKIKTEKKGLENLSPDEIRKLVRSAGLSKHTVPELKDWLISKGLTSSGKKAALVERIEQWAEEN